MIVQDILDHLISAEWHEYETEFAVFSEADDPISGAMMRRRVNGAVQYRPMTEEEIAVFEDRFRFS